MKLNHFTVLALTASALALNGCSSSDKKEASTTPPSAQNATAQAETEAKTPMDSKQMMNSMALNHLHHINQKEIAMSELAKNKAQSEAVKQNAQFILSDHQALSEKVKSSATEMQIELVDYSPSTYEKSVTSALEKLEGAEFDKAYMNQMVLGHNMAIDQLKRAKTVSTDQQVTALINQALPSIQQHQYTSRQMAENQGYLIEPIAEMAE